MSYLAHLDVVLYFSIQLLVQVVVLLQSVVAAAAVLVVVRLDLLTAVTCADLQAHQRGFTMKS